MRTSATYLVISRGSRGRPVIRRTTMRIPSLAPGEVTIRVVLDIPDSVLDMPTILLEVPEGIQSVVAIEAAPLEDA